MNFFLGNFEERRGGWRKLTVTSYSTVQHKLTSLLLHTLSYRRLATLIDRYIVESLLNGQESLSYRRLAGYID
jgi:hypothetical protein